MLKTLIRAALAAPLLLTMTPAAGAADEGRETRTPRYGQDAVINFAAGDGIRDWYASNDRSIYIMDRTGRWYYATLSGPCQGLRFNQGVAFETDPTGRFDTFSAIRTRFHRCHVDKLVRAPRPAAKGGKGGD